MNSKKIHVERKSKEKFNDQANYSVIKPSSNSSEYLIFHVLFSEKSRKTWRSVREMWKYLLWQYLINTNSISVVHLNVLGMSATLNPIIK